ncbi:MAG: DUF6472 family protein [Acutalibacteraceae bacterium]
MSRGRDDICAQCAYNDYDDESADYVCTACADEDDYYRFLQNRSSCPYFRPYDEYKIVRRQN